MNVLNYITHIKCYLILVISQYTLVSSLIHKAIFSIGGALSFMEFPQWKLCVIVVHVSDDWWV